MGVGDVILAPLLGMYLGWLNPGIVAPGCSSVSSPAPSSAWR